MNKKVYSSVLCFSLALGLSLAPRTSSAINVKRFVRNMQNSKRGKIATAMVLTAAIVGTAMAGRAELVQAYSPLDHESIYNAAYNVHQDYLSGNYLKEGIDGKVLQDTVQSSVDTGSSSDLGYHGIFTDHLGNYPYQGSDGHMHPLLDHYNGDISKISSDIANGYTSRLDDVATELMNESGF